MDADQWVAQKRKNNTYLFPKPAMQKIYKGYFLDQLRLLISKGKLEINDLPALEKSIARAGYKKWNVYAKKPFGGPLQVLEYLGRYTHKVAITAHRIRSIDEKNNTWNMKEAPNRFDVFKGKTVGRGQSTGGNPMQKAKGGK